MLNKRIIKQWPYRKHWQCAHLVCSKLNALNTNIWTSNIKIFGYVPDRLNSVHTKVVRLTLQILPSVSSCSIYKDSVESEAACVLLAAPATYKDSVESEAACVLLAAPELSGFRSVFKERKCYPQV